MSALLLSKRKADVIGNGLGLIGLGFLFYTNYWWPGIMLVIWVTLAARQFFTGRFYDLALTSIIIGVIFSVNFFQVDVSTLMPALLVLGGVYILLREYFYSDDNDTPTATEVKKDVKDDSESGRPSY